MIYANNAWLMADPPGNRRTPADFAKNHLGRGEGAGAVSVMALTRFPAPLK